LSSSTVECEVSWPRPVTAGAPPVVELPLLPGYLASCDAAASIGLTRSLHVVWRVQIPKYPGAPTSRRPHRSPSRHSRVSEVPLSGLGSPAQFHRLHTARSGGTEMPTRPCSVRGSFPYSVLPVARSHLAPADPCPPVRLRPQGFAPSRRFAPPTTCRACFIPVPLLGFPFEACSPPGAVRSLERRTPQVFGEALADRASPSGIEHTGQILPAGLGFSQVTASLPPWD